MDIFVRPHDSLWYYSDLFNIPLVLIEQANPQIKPAFLVVGQRINIPGYVLYEYMIKEHDTLWTIANQHNLAIDSLFLVNQQINPNQLQIGQTIMLPHRVTNLIVDDINNYTYEKMLSHIEQLTSIYPFITMQSIGQSVMGKDIIALQIGEGAKHVHLNGSFHANEWITTPVIMRFINEYLLALTNNESIRGRLMLPLFLETRLSVVPMVNPDGVNLVIDGISAAGQYSSEVLEINGENEDFSNWKANIRGVDLNNQFPAQWDIEAERKPKQPAPRDYPGPYPLSEPEAIAIADYTSISDFSRVNAFHTQGEVIFWGFEGLEPPESGFIANEYARVSEYQPIRYVDSYAGYKDWFIQDFSRPGFTVELGRGINPLPIEQFPEIYENSLGIMLANLYL